MAPIHRMDMYHEVAPPPPPPPPIPVKLKPKTLKKLSQQARGPVYVIVPHRPRPMRQIQPMPPPPPPPRSVLNYKGNFTLVNPSMGSSNGSVSGDHHHRYTRNSAANKPSRSQPRQWSRVNRPSSNWVKHLTSEEDVNEEDEPDAKSVISMKKSLSAANLLLDQPQPAPERRMNGKRTITELHPANSCLVGEIQLSSRVASMTITDVSPRFALKKILMLADNKQYRESANFINRLSCNTFGVIVHDLPVDQFIDAMPQSLPIVESLYAKVFLSDGVNCSIQFLRPENVVMQMVRYFAQQEGPPPSGSASSATSALAAQNNGNNWRWDYCGPFISSCKKLLRVIVLSEPKIRKGLAQKRRALDKAIEGLGQHGLVGTSDENLMHLHDALQQEFSRVVQSYKVALAKLEELDLAHKKGTSRTVNNGPAPISASHQRLLSLKQSEIQERLIKNKTLLNVVEPTLTNHSLDLFLGILQRRIELDKDVLFQFTQLRREGANGKAVESPNIVIAPILMKFSHGCQQVLDLMKEVAAGDPGQEDDDLEEGSDVSAGYHSDSDSAVMASGNSPFVSKSARYHFLSRSVRLGSRASVRTSLLINSLGLEPAGRAKGQSGQGRAAADGRRTLVAKAASSASSQHSASSDKESDCLSSGFSSGSGSPDPRTAALGGGGGTSAMSAAAQCQRCQQQAPGSTDSESELQLELEAVKAELARANATIATIQEREIKLKARLANQAQRMVESGVNPGKFEPAIAGEQRANLIRSYGNLYSQSRVETLEYLDKLDELRGADELKSKLLFSVIVLAFRSLHATSSQMKDHVRRILQIPPGLAVQQPHHHANNNNSTVPPPPPPPPCILSAPGAPSARPSPPPVAIKRHKERNNPAVEVELAVASYLRQSVDTFDLTKNTEDVCNQIWATLYDYPCLRSCEKLVRYIKDSVRLAWALVNQSPPFVLEYETRNFNPEYHVRFHASRPDDNSIKTYLWPALVEGYNGPCLHKAVVIT